MNLYNYESRESWLRARQEGIGASEVAILFGLAPASWGSPYSLWAQKTGKVPRVDIEGEYLEIGTLVEPVVATLYEKRTGRKLWDGGPFAVAKHERLSMLRATPDRLVLDAPGMPGPGDLQIKNAGWYMAHDWDSGIPDHVTMQVQTEIACMGVEWGSAAVLIGGNAFKKFDILRDANLIAEIEAQVEWFWDLVQRDVPPPIDGHRATTEILKRLHPHDNGEEIELPPVAEEWFAEWEAAKAELKAAKTANENRIESAQNKLKAAIGPNTFGVLPDGRRLTLKTTSVAEQMRDGYTFRQLRIEAKGKRK